MLFHPRLGVGPKGLDRERMIEYPTLARRAVARQLERETMAEELRLLYVAMTRAEEKLILSVALTRGMKNLEDLAGDASAPVSPAVLESQPSVGAWILLHALTRRRRGDVWRMRRIWKRNWSQRWRMRSHGAILTRRRSLCPLSSQPLS